MYERLERKWKIVGTNIPFQTVFAIKVDISDFPGDCDSLVLILDGTPHYADSIVGGVAYYSNLMWYGYGMTFTFGRGTVLWEETVASKGRRGPESRPDSHSMDGSGNATVSVYPNPSTGRYNIQVSGCESVSVTIYNTHGAAVRQFSDSGKSQYHFDGELPTGNVYYVTITTPEGVQTTKLTIR